MALSSISMNIARSVGPALGGVVVAQAGPPWAFAFNAVSFAGMLAVLWVWKRPPDPGRLPPEHLT